MPKVKCAFCGEYLDKDEAVRNGVQSFHREHMFSKSKTQPRKKKKKDVPDDLRRDVLRLDGSSCRFCGVRSPSGLHLHHVVYRSSGGLHEQSNLITLCLKCHDIVHSDKRRYQPLCLGIIWLRSVNGDKQMRIPYLERKLNETS